MQVDRVKVKLKAEQILRSRSLTDQAIARVWNDRLTLVAIVIIAILTLAAIAAPLITGILGVDPNTTDASGSRFLPIFSEGHILGTDNLGRDHLARLLYAGQVSLFIGFMSAFLALAIGVSLGIVTGYYGGLIDDLVNWIITTLNSIPALVLLIVITAVFSPDAPDSDFGHCISDLDGNHAPGSWRNSGYSVARIHCQRQSNRRIRPSCHAGAHFA